MDVHATNIVRIPLKANVPTKKKYNVAKFHTPNLDFATFAKPVRMYRATHAPEQPAPQPTEHVRMPFKKKFVPQTPKAKDKEQPWHIEDGAGNNAYDGTKDGQTANYVLLVYENQAFHVIPCNDWYNFRPKRTYQTLSLEEAEAKMNTIRLKGERAASKMDKNPLATPAATKDKPEGVAAPAQGQRDKEDEEFQTHEEEEEDKFAAFGKTGSDEESKPKTKSKKSKKGGDEEGEADNEDDEEGEKDEEEPDWKGMFDDDEEEQFADDGDEEEPKGIRENTEGEAEGEDSALTDAGKELRKILKNHRDEDSEGSEELEESDDDDDDDFDEEKLPNLIFPTLPPTSSAQTTADVKSEDNSKKEPVTDSTRSSTPPIPGSPSKEKKKSSKSKGSKKNKPEKEKGEEKKPKSESKAKKTGGSPTANTDSPVVSAPAAAATKSGVKRPASPDTGASNTTTKKPKTELKVSEAEVIKLLKKHPKGLPTLDFIKHFKSAIAADPEQKNKLTAITTKVCAIATKGILILKTEYNK